MDDEAPLFRVIRGTPAAEELAALVGVLGMARRRRTDARPPSGAWWAAALPGR